MKILSLSALDSTDINLEVMFRDYTRDDFVNKGET